MNPYQRLIGRYVAARLVHLPKHRGVDFRIKHLGSKMFLQRTPDTVLEGEPAYSLRFYEKRQGWRRLVFGRLDYSRLGHAILGPVLSSKAGWVERRIQKVSGADIHAAGGGWISGWGGVNPPDFSVTEALTMISSRDGVVLPCWKDTANSPTKDWVVHVHGRGASAAETARNFAFVSSLGFNNLAIHYRGDGYALRYGMPDKSMLALGSEEWVDVEACVAHLEAAGAERIFVVAWSYGAAISLQFAKRSPLAERVSGYFLDSPVISWRDTLKFQVALAHAPRHFAVLGEKFLCNDSAAMSIGFLRGIDFDEFEIAAYAKSITKRVVIVHSQNDGFIPIEPCRNLAAERPDLVKLIEFEGARHCKLLNHDAEKYEGALASLLNG